MNKVRFQMDLLDLLNTSCIDCIVAGVNRQAIVESVKANGACWAVYCVDVLDRYQTKVIGSDIDR